MNAATIRQYLKDNDLHHRELAEMVGVSTSAATKWVREPDPQPPSGPALKLLEFLIEGKRPFPARRATPPEAVPA